MSHNAPTVHKLHVTHKPALAPGHSGDVVSHPAIHRMILGCIKAEMAQDHRRGLHPHRS